MNNFVFIIFLHLQSSLLYNYISWPWRLASAHMIQSNRNTTRKSQMYLQQAEKITKLLTTYTSKQFLTKHSLLNNLFSSQQFSISPPNKQFSKIYFGKEAIQENQIYEFTYFHKRDKKMLLFYFILNFLRNQEKIEMIIFENGDKINTMELRDFISNQKFGGSDNLIKQLETRIIFFRAETHQVYKLNLHYLPLYVQQRQFLKAIILSDVNEFESGDKSSLERIYKKIPKNLFILSFKKEIYDYKFIQKASMPFLVQADEVSDHYELHQKVSRNINKVIQGFKSHHGYIVPIQQVGVSSKTLDESFRSVVIRKDDEGQLSQTVFSVWPFQLKAYRKIV